MSMTAVERVKQMVSEGKVEDSPAPAPAQEAAPAETAPQDGGMPPVENDEAPEETAAPSVSNEQEGDKTPAAGDTETQQPRQSKKEMLAGKTPMEKAEFAFKKQLARTREKYETRMQALEKQMQELKQAKENPEKAKGRDDFDSDEEYMAYLVDRRLNGKTTERQLADLETEKRNAAAQEQFERASAIYRRNIEAVIPESERQAFLQEVTEARDNGFENVLKKVPDVMDFITTNKMGPLVLREFIKNKDAFTHVVYAGGPMDRALELRALGKELFAANTSSAPAQKPAAALPVIGKPGAQPTGAKATQGPGSSASSMLAFIRKNRSYRGHSN